MLQACYMHELLQASFANPTAHSGKSMVFTMRPLKKATSPGGLTAEELELSEAPLEESIPLSEAAGSFGASVPPTSQQPLPPMPPPMPPMHTRAPLPPMLLSTLQRMPCGNLSADCLPMPLRNVTGPGRSSGDWSDAPTIILASLDSKIHDSLCGGVWEQDLCRSLSPANSGCDDLDDDRLFDFSSGLEVNP